MDGSYVFDVTVRHRFGGANYLTVVEAKMHNNPIKRELVQALHSKAKSVGSSQKPTASPLSRPSVSETRALQPTPALTREQAAKRFGLPTFVGHCYASGESPGSTTCTLISTEHPEYIETLLLGSEVPPKDRG